MDWIGSEQIPTLLPMGEAISELRTALSDPALVAGPRHIAELPGGATLVMPAEDGVYTGIKLLNHRPERIPSLPGGVFLFDRGTGVLLGGVDGTALTGLRTGALAGLATDLMAPEGARTMALIGTGFQGWFQAQAVLAVRPVNRIYLFNRTPSKAKALAGRLERAHPGLAVGVCDSVAEAASAVEIVTVSTAARTPVLRRADLGERWHLNAIGNFRPDEQELASDVPASADVIVMDSEAACMAEAGDLLVPLEEGRIEADRLMALQAILETPPRAGRTLFKSVGSAIFDLALARVIYERAVGPGGRARH